jgi:VCBS repeat-containing protein
MSRHSNRPTSSRTIDRPVTHRLKTSQETAKSAPATGESASVVMRDEVPPHRRTRVAPASGETADGVQASSAAQTAVRRSVSAAPEPSPVAAATGAVGEDVVSGAFAPLLAPGGGVPPQSPAVWVLAAVARRELGQSDATTGSQSLAVAAALVTANSAPLAMLTKQGAPNVKTGKVTGKVTASDPDGNKLAFVSPITTAKGTVTITSKGVFTYTPTAAARHAAAAMTASAAAKMDTFKIVVSDGLGGVTNVPVTVTIAPANSAPGVKATVNKPDPVTGAVTGQITVADKDADTPTFAATAPTNGSVVIKSDGTFTYKPTAAARDTARVTRSGDTDKFTVTVNDGHGSTKAIPITVTIAPSDTAPVNGFVTVATPDAKTGAVKGVVTARDNENDPLTFNGSTTTAKGKVTVLRDGSFTYTPTAAARHEATAIGATSQVKTDTFTVKVVDKYGAATAVLVTVNILGKNTGPVNGKATLGKPDSATGAVTGTIVASDAEKDALTYAGSTTTSQGKVVVNGNGTFTYTPTPAARAKAAVTDATSADKQFTFTATASDGHGAITPIRVTVAISPNTPPEGAKATVGQPNPTTGVVTGTVSAADPDGDALTYGSVGAPAKGTLTVTPQGTFSYTPTAAARHAASADGATTDKQDTITISVSDGKGAVTLVNVTISILGANSAPSVGNASYSVDAGKQLSNNVLAGASDPDGDSLTVGFVSGRDHGSLALNSNGTFTYTPAAGFNGTDTFTYTVNDGHGSIKTATATVVVNYVAPPQTGPTGGVRGDDYPVNLKNAALDALVDPWNFYNRECTSFVAWRLNSANKIAFTNLMRGGRWGNATNWAANARSLGFAVNSTPAVGSVGWLSSGHVAWVAAVNGNSVTIEEYNYGYTGKYATRTVNASYFNAYIHIADITASTTTYPVGTVMARTQKMSAANLASQLLGWYEAGAKVSLVCYARGQSVKGYYSYAISGGYDNLWYKTADGVFTADVDINTGSNNPVTGAC